MSKTGSNIRRRRLRQGLMQKELAARAGVSPASVTHIENGRYIPRAATAAKLAAALGVTLDQIFFEEPPQKPERKIGVFDTYQKILIREAIEHRIRQEAEVLALGMGVTVDQVLEEYYANAQFTMHNDLEVKL